MANERRSIDLQKGEAAIVHAASRIFSAFVVSGKVTDSNEEAMVKRSIGIAINMGQDVDIIVDDQDEYTDMGKSPY